MAAGFISSGQFDHDRLYDTYSHDDRATFHDLNGSQCAVVFSSLLEKYKDQMEEAKMRCEDDEDDTSLGEYISLKSVVEQMEKFISTMIMQEYSKSALDNSLKQSKGYDTYRRLTGQGRY